MLSPTELQCAEDAELCLNTGREPKESDFLSLVKSLHDDAANPELTHMTGGPCVSVPVTFLKQTCLVTRHMVRVLEPKSESKSHVTVMERLRARVPDIDEMHDAVINHLVEVYAKTSITARIDMLQVFGWAPTTAQFNALRARFIADGLRQVDWSDTTLILSWSY